MIQPGNISHWLQHPDTLTETDQKHLEALLHQYPYLLPAKILSAVFIHKSQPFSPRVSDTSILHAGNPILFYDLLLHVTGNKRTVTVNEDTSNHIPENLAADQETMSAIQNEENLIQPIYTEDYFLHQGIAVDDHIPQELDHVAPKAANKDDDKDMALMRMMSFSEWLMYFKTKTEKEKEEEEDKKALKSMWQKEKLAAAMEEENDEIPENVFEMAVNSITKEEGLISESFAEILIKQGKRDKAIEMYRKLSLRNPQKNAYFAQKIEAVLKDKKS